MSKTLIVAFFILIQSAVAHANNSIRWQQNSVVSDDVRSAVEEKIASACNSLIAVQEQSSSVKTERVDQHAFDKIFQIELQGHYYWQQHPIYVRVFVKATIWAEGDITINGLQADDQHVCISAN